MLLIFAIVAASAFITTWTLLRAIERRMYARAVVRYHLNKLMED